MNSDSEKQVTAKAVPHKKRAAALAGLMLMAGCATNPNGTASSSAQQFKQVFASDDPCANNARNMGIAAGTVLGLVLGNKLGDGKSGSLVAGALVGGMVGGLIGADMDRKRCEFAKVAKQYNLELRYSPIDANGDVVADQGGKLDTGKTAAAAPTVGSTLTVRDKGGVAGHFVSGSDQLSPTAKEYFAAIASQYGAAKMLQGQTDANQRDEVGKQIANRRLFLIGHTDDMGSTQLNASLSERRAKAVASFLKQQGISEETLYYQGAGETLPVGDNRTEDGRAENRRVELLEIADEEAFKKYLTARKPNYSFYRPQTAEQQASANPLSVARPAASASKTNVAAAPVAVNAAKPIASKFKQPVAIGRPAASTAGSTGVAAAEKLPLLNFGGQPYSPAEAVLGVSSIAPTRTGFSLISVANADATVVLSDCTQDRPRAAGTVRSLKEGAAYKTNEHIAQLYGKTWAADVNGNLVVINRLAVLRDGGAPANLPELKVYAQYKPGVAKKPEISEEPLVNTYRVNQGLLYRMFAHGDAGLRCMDVLFGTDGAVSAKAGKIIYGSAGSSFVANFKPQLQ